MFFNKNVLKMFCKYQIYLFKDLNNIIILFINVLIKLKNFKILLICQRIYINKFL